MYFNTRNINYSRVNVCGRVIVLLAVALFAVSSLYAQVAVTARLDSVQFYVEIGRAHV